MLASQNCARDASQQAGVGGEAAAGAPGNSPQSLADKLAAPDESRAWSDSGVSTDSEGASFHTAASRAEGGGGSFAPPPHNCSYQSLSGFEGSLGQAADGGASPATRQVPPA